MWTIPTSLENDGWPWLAFTPNDSLIFIYHLIMFYVTENPLTSAYLKKTLHCIFYVFLVIFVICLIASVFTEECCGWQWSIAWYFCIGDANRKWNYWIVNTLRKWEDIRGLIFLGKFLVNCHLIVWFNVE